jgi:hypothetical protein
MARAGDAAYEAIRTLNHATISRTVPAPVAYDVLGSLQQVGFALDQLTRQLGAGLVRSLTTHDVYDDQGDPAASVAQAVDALLLAGQHARRVGECLSTAQAAISGQGHTGPKKDQR